MDWSSKKPVEIGEAVSCGTEEHLFAVRRPTHGNVIAWVIRKPFGKTALRGHHKNIDISVVLAGKCDLCSIRREHRIGLHTGSGRKSLSVATLARHAPEISRIDKNDLRATERRFLQEQR